MARRRRVFFHRFCLCRSLMSKISCLFGFVFCSFVLGYVLDKHSLPVWFPSAFSASSPCIGLRHDTTTGSDHSSGRTRVTSTITHREPENFSPIYPSLVVACVLNRLESTSFSKALSLCTSHLIFETERIDSNLHRLANSEVHVIVLVTLVPRSSLLRLTVDYASFSIQSRNHSEGIRLGRTLVKIGKMGLFVVWPINVGKWHGSGKEISGHWPIFGGPLALRRSIRSILSSSLVNLNIWLVRCKVSTGRGLLLILISQSAKTWINHISFDLNHYRVVGFPLVLTSSPSHRILVSSHGISEILPFSVDVTEDQLSSTSHSRRRESEPNLGQTRWWWRMNSFWAWPFNSEDVKLVGPLRVLGLKPTVLSKDLACSPNQSDSDLDLLLQDQFLFTLPLSIHIRWKKPLMQLRSSRWQLGYAGDSVKPRSLILSNIMSQAVLIPSSNLSLKKSLSISSLWEKPIPPSSFFKERSLPSLSLFMRVASIPFGEPQWLVISLNVLLSFREVSSRPEEAMRFVLSRTIGCDVLVLVKSHYAAVAVTTPLLTVPCFVRLVFSLASRCFNLSDLRVNALSNCLQFVSLSRRCISVLALLLATRLAFWVMSNYAFLLVIL